MCADNSPPVSQGKHCIRPAQRDAKEGTGIYIERERERGGGREARDERMYVNTNEEESFGGAGRRERIEKWEDVC